jgi:hypothetical protein
LTLVPITALPCEVIFNCQSIRIAYWASFLLLHKEFHTGRPA